MVQLAMSDTYAERLGQRLRSVRKQKRLSLQAVEASSEHEFKASVLGAYERGERAISVPRLQRLARFYRVPVDQLLAGEPSADGGRGNGVAAGAGGEPVGGLEAGGGLSPAGEDSRVAIDLTRLDGLPTPERDLLGRYLGMIQVQRRDFRGPVVTIRSEDVRAIAFLLETSVPAMQDRLAQLGLRP